MSRAVRVSLSSGDAFYIDAYLQDVVALFNDRGLVPVGGRFVNASQVAQLTVEVLPSVEIPESLEDPCQED